MFEFGNFKLDAEAVRLVKLNQNIDLEPQVFNTLLLLVKNRNRVVSKEELLEEIWQGRTVTDYVITRIIYELRKVLDEDNDSDSYIRTVRGKGYQFLQPVNEVSLFNSATSNDKQSNKDRSKLLLLPLLIIFAVVLIIQLNNMVNGRKVEETEANSINNDKYQIVTVMPIEHSRESDEISILTQSLLDYLTNQLAINLKMKVIHPDSLINLHSNDDIWSVQQATNSDYIIQGFIETVAESSIKIHLNLYVKNKDDEMIPYALGAFGFPFPESSKDLKDLYKQRKDTVRSIIKIIKPGMVVQDDGKTETKDPEAYRLVIAAHHLSRNDSCDSFPRSEKLLLRAVERDPEFAYAYNRLFSNYFKRSWLCGESAEYRIKGMEMADIAESLAPNSYQSMKVAQNTILVETGQLEKAFEKTQHTDWNDVDGLYRKIYAMRYAGFLKLSDKHVKHILQLDPFFFSQKPIQQAPHTLLYQGKYNEYLSLLAEPGNAYHDYYRGFTYLLLNRLDEASVVLNSVVKSMPNDMFGRFAQALLFIIENKDEQAVLVADEIVNLRESRMHEDGEMSYKIVQLYALAGDQKSALLHLNIAVDGGFFPFNYFTIDPAIKSIRNDPEFTLILNKAKERHALFAKRFNLESEVE